MKIGLDAKWFFDGPPSGRRVVRGLAHGLAEVLTADDELHLFLDARFRSAPSPAISDVRCHHVWGKVNQLSNLFVLPRVADRLALDAVVYQNFVPLPLGVRHARIALVHDVIFDEHPEFFTRPERIYFSTLRRLSRHADRVCTVSGTERARLIRLAYAEGHVIDVVPNAVDDIFRSGLPASAARTADILGSVAVRSRFVLYVGRLTARKNVATLVRAMAQLETRDLVLLIVGPMDATCPDLQALALASGVAERVVFAGPRDDIALPLLYAAASVFCFPSLDESFGLPPLEAMASGTPVIVSDIAVLRETCGDAAVYVDATDVRAIAAAIDDVVNDDARRVAVREAGIRHAGSFTWRTSAACLLDTVRAALENRP